jgi:peptide/nickel transport system substrate-binding protein
MAPFYPQTDTSVPQRAQDLAQAKQLLADAGYPNGFKTQMNVAKTVEVPQYAQLVQASAKQIGVDIDLVVQDLGTYYGDGVFGSSPWLDSIMSLVDYAHRSVPNTLLSAPLLSDGTWNAAHFKNSDYDALVPQFIGTADLQTQQGISRQIQELLLDETPIIYAYFYQFLSAVASNVSGVVNTAVGQIFLDQASISA